jgi:Transmembrane domain of unknown function (DUF3566)
VSTEEDGVDEPTRSTQPSLIMAPPGLEADPDGEAADAVVDNGIMASSRMRAGSPRSTADQRDGAAVEDAAVDDVAPRAKKTTDTTSASAAPLPADTIGKAKAGAADGPKTGAADGKPKAGAADRPKTGAADGKPKAGAADRTATDTPAAPAEAAPPEAATVKSPKPSFTPSVPTPVAPTMPAATAASPAAARPAAATPPYPGAESSYAPPSSYSRPDQPAGPRSSAGNGSSPGAASAVAGAAAGLANSVASAWQRRGPSGRPAGTRGTQVRSKPARRQAMLTLARVEPWSVMKFSFVASVVAFIILFVAVAVLYMILAALGVFDSLQHTVSTITGAQGTTGTDISHYYSASVVLGYTAMLGALNIVLITAMSTVGSVIYNLIAKTIGGIEVTLRETD